MEAVRAHVVKQIGNGERFFPVYGFNARDDERVSEAVEVEEVERRDARAGDRDDGKFPDDARSLAM